MRKKILFVISLFLLVLQLPAQQLCNWDIIDKNGNILFRINGAKDVGLFSEDRIVVKKNGFSIILNEQFNEVFRSDKYDIVRFSKMKSGRIPYFDYSKRHFGYLDKNGNPAILAKFTDAQSFSAGLAIVGVGGQVFNRQDPDKKYGLINAEGKIILPCEYSGLFSIKSDSWKGYGFKKGRYYLLKKENDKIVEKILPHKVSLRGGFSNYVFFRKESLTGLMNWNGAILCKQRYKTIYDGSKTEIVAKSARTKGSLFDINGKLLIKGDKSIIGLIGDKYLRILTDENKQIIVDRHFNEVLSEPYDYIVYWGNGVVQLVLGNTIGFYNIEKKQFITKMKYDVFYGAMSDNGIFVAGNKIP